MDEQQRRNLDREGFVLFKGVLRREEIVALVERLEALWVEEGDQAGAENYIEKNTRRLANLVNKGDIFRPILSHPAVLEAVRAVLGPAVHLSMLNARDALPGAGPSQPLHSDADHGAKPDERGFLACTAIWMLDDFTCQNGATRLVPGTHRDPRLPKEALADVLTPHPAEVIVEGAAGDVLVFNGHCWHAGGANRTQGPRRAILAHYIRADLPQRLNQKQALAAEVQTRLTKGEREILGLDD
jgi:ectoine hydroxylase-related dioxygenase (phytanoyl-CoA dioxygenase family)